MLQQARQCLILSLLVAHNPKFSYSIIRETPLSAQDDTFGFVYTEAKYALSVLREKSLENLLETLQTLLSARKRADWPVICFAL